MQVRMSQAQVERQFWGVGKMTDSSSGKLKQLFPYSGDKFRVNILHVLVSSSKSKK